MNQHASVMIGTSRDRAAWRHRVKPGGDPPVLSLAAFIGFVVIIVAHLVGLIGSSAFPIITVASILCSSVGIKLYAPKPQWPWWVLASSGMFWTVSGILRATTNATGNLTNTRSLMPDAFALPGYAVFALGLYGLLRHRQGERQPGRILDTTMLGLGSLLIVYELILAPTLDMKGSSTQARLAVSVYPLVSLVMNNFPQLAPSNYYVIHFHRQVTAALFASGIDPAKSIVFANPTRTAA